MKKKLITVKEVNYYGKGWRLGRARWQPLHQLISSKALARRVDQLHDVKIRAGVVPYMPHKRCHRYRRTFYLSFMALIIWNREKTINGNKYKVYFQPIKYSEIERYIAEMQTSRNFSNTSFLPMGYMVNLNPLVYQLLMLIALSKT